MNSFRNPSFRSLVLSLGLLAACFAPRARAEEPPQCEGLGLATSFNAFVFEDWSATSSDVEGRIAVGGHLSVNHYSLGDKLDPATAGISVVVGGDFTFPSGRLYYGDAVVGGSAAGVGAAVLNGLAPDQTISDHAELPFDFGEARERAILRSQAIAELPANGTWVSQWGGLTLTGAPEAELQVFELPAQLVWDAHTFDVQQIPAGATVVFNIRGANAGLTNMSLQSLASIRRRVLFNFPEATALTLAGIGVEGSILAPLAAIQNPQGVIKGNLVARSWSGMMQLNHEPFEGCGLPDGMVADENGPPQIVSVPAAMVDEGAVYAYDVNAIDPDEDVLNHSLDREPGSASIDAASGLLHWPSNSGFVGSTRARNTMCRLPSGPGLFNPEVVWTWNGPPGQVQHGGVYGPVLVGQFTDDNGDGNIDASDRPDIVAMSRSSSQRYLNLIDGATGATHWSIRADDIAAYGTPAIGDIDGDGRMEIVAEFGDSGQQVRAYDEVGQELWRASVPSRSVITGGYRDAIALADLEGDGSVEVIRGRTIIESNGQMRCSGTGDSGGTSNYGWAPVVADIDLDGVQEIIAGRSVYRPDCSIKMQLDATADGFAAIGNFDADDEAEIVLVSNGSSSATGRLYLFDHDGRRIFGPVSFPGGGVLGPPTLANVDDDAYPEIGIAGRANYAVFDHTGALMWSQQVQDTSSSQTGSTSFDFEANGKAEIVYSDELNLRVFDGATGTVRMILPNTSGTTLEYPVIVDADGDGSADILIGANDGGNGIRMISSATRSWAPTRSLWNQHAYHVDNINDDGSIPRVPTRSWLKHNTFRLNVFPDQHALGQPDLALFDLRLDESDGTAVKVLAVNRGLAPTSGPAVVEVFNGSPEAGGNLLGTLAIPPLAAGAEITLTLTGLSPEAVNNDVYARIADSPAIVECDYGNNDAWAAYFEVRATDPDGLFDAQRFTITVENVNEAPSILTDVLPPAEINEAYRVEIQATDPDCGDGLRFELVSGPAGMAIDPVSGELRWTPNGQQGGPHEVALRVVDLAGLSGERTLSVEVRINHPPQIVSTPPTTVQVGAIYSYDVEATDPDDDVLAFTMLNAPLGMSIDGTTGLIVWTPAAWQTGTHAVRVQVGDGRGGDAVQMFEIVVTQRVNRPPQIVSVPPGSVDEGARYLYDVDAVDPDGDALRYVLAHAPQDATVVDTNGALAWTAIAAWTQSVRAQNTSCRIAAQAAPFDPVVRWHWNTPVVHTDYADVMMSPVVVQTNDDNGDGRVDVSDTPDIAIVSYTGRDLGGRGILRVIDGRNGNELAASDPAYWVDAYSQIAAGDIDNDGAIDFVGVRGSDGSVFAFNSDLSLKWSRTYTATRLGWSLGGASLADLDGDGNTEIIFGNAVLRSDGSLLWKGSGSFIGSNHDGHGGALSVAADILPSPGLEVIAGPSVYAADGTLLWSYSGIGDGTVAIGDLDGDAEPEIVIVGIGRFVVLSASGELVLGPIALPSGRGGPPTLGDMDGDGRLEIGIAGRSAYYAFDAMGTLRWSVPIVDNSSNLTGSTIFDFDGDGRVEVVNADEFTLRIVDGASGTVRWSLPNASGTASEYPVIADVDGDGSADILVTSNQYYGGSQRGVRMISSASHAWAPTRSIWNQHAYHVDNINDDGSIPAHPAKSWLGHNTFRLNTFADRDPLGQPDLALFDLRLDESGNSVSVQVVNRGLAPTGTSTTLELFNGLLSDGIPLGSLEVPVLAAGEARTLTLVLADPAAVDTALSARVDRDDVVTECLEDNNVTLAAYFDLRAIDPEGLYDTQRFTVAVENVNEAPSLLTTEIPPAGVNQDYRYRLLAQDPDLGDGLRFDLQSAPEGLVVEPVSGELRWTPTAAQAGTFQFTARVTDLGGLSDAVELSILVSDNHPPTITSVPSFTATPTVEYRYEAQATDADGDALGFALSQAPSGMQIDTLNGVVTWIPSSAQIGTHLVEVRVNDSRGAYALQRYSLLVAIPPNRPPTIISVPSTLALPGHPYTYFVEATDPDGDVVVPSLPVAPAGMTLDVSTSQVRWTPTSEQVGSHAVRVQVDDGRGGITNQDFAIEVNVSGANQPPVILSTPPYTAKVGRAYSYAVQATDADGDVLAWSLSQSPTGMAIDPATGLISWTPDAPGSVPVRVRVSDGGYWVEQGWTLTVLAAEVELGGTVLVSPQPVAPGGSISITVAVEGAAGPVTVTATLDGEPIALAPNASTTITAPSTPGTHTLVVQISDGQDEAEIVQTFNVLDPSDTTPPVVEITSPGASDDITVTDVATLTDIVGTASDANLAEYRLLISDAGKSQWSVLTTGSASVVDATLGNLNPQTIANGLYDIGLIATDLGGNQASAKITVAVVGEQKTAPLQLTFEDLSFDIQGLPLTVRRTYDSLKRLNDLDFGYGWSVDYQDLWLQTNGVLGRGWTIQETGSGLNRQLCVRPSGSRVASIRLPGGQLEQFTLRASPECVSVLTWTGYINGIVFSPHARNKSGSKLEALNYGDLRIAGGDLFDMDTTETFNPTLFRLTLLDGTEYTLDQDFGIRQIKDKHGNTLQFTAGGISHSGGWALQFARDAAGRITQILAPGNKTLSYGYDGQGNLTSMTDEIGAVSTYAYNAPSVPHALTNYTDPLGRLLLKTEYDAEGRVIRQTDGAGQPVTIATDNENQRQTIEDRNGNSTTYEFDDRGNVTQVTDAAGGITRYAYDANDNEIEVIDPLGRKTTRTFDQYGNITGETDPLGRTTATVYNPQGNVTSLTDAAGQITTNTWSPNNELTRITNPLGQATNLGYSGRGSLASLTDAEGNQTSYSYARINGTDLKQSETAPDGTVTSYGYDAAGNVTATSSSLTLGEGDSPVAVSTSSTWDAKGRLTSQTDADGNTRSYQYNAAGELTQETDPLGRVTQHSYTVRGEKAQTTYPDGLKDSWQYDNNGNETRSCNGDGGLCTSTQYDALDRPTQVTDPAGYITSTAYDAAGQIIETTDGRGNTTGYEYDAAGRQTRLTNALGHSSTSSYDLAGNLASETNALGQTIEHSYNAANQRTSTTLPTGVTTLWSYNDIGQRSAENTPEGRTISYAYDSLGRLASVTDALTNSTGYQYNQQGQLLSQTDAEGKATRYGYDVAGRRVSRTLADGSSEAMSYNAVGQLIQKTDFDGSATTWEYGSAGSESGRFLRLLRPDGSQQQVAYDAHGRPIGHTDSRDGAENLTLDALGRVTQRNLSHSAAQLSGSTAYGHATQYQWDANGNRDRLRIADPDRDIVASYDAVNQLHTLDSLEGQQAIFTHDAAGRLTQIERSDGSTSSYAYDAAGQLTGIHHQDADGNTLARFDYTLNLDGQRTQAIEEINAGADSVRRSVSWQYDMAGKLTQEQIVQTQPVAQNLTIAYTHDKVGNRTARTITGDISQTTTYSYDVNDRLTQEVDSLHGTTTYSYDLKGNLRQKQNGGDTTTYTWNSDNRLTKVETGAKTISYGYDPQGRRIKKLVTEGTDTTETHYVLDTERAYHEVVIERTRTNTGPWQERTYLHTPNGVGELISDSDGTTTRQVYADGQGSTRLTVDGAATQSWNFDAFGNLLEGGSAPVTHLYTGERYDADTGLIYLRARDYDPRTGRFISMDEHPGSQRIPLMLNKYLYGNADPISNIDPSGHFTIGGMMSVAMNLSIAYVRMSLFDMLSERLVSPIVDALVPNVAEGTTMSGGKIFVNVLLNSLATQCAVVRKKCFIKKIPVLSHGVALRLHAAHILASQHGLGNTASGYGVTSSILVRGMPHKRGWYNQYYPCNAGVKGDKLTCDEYPFASTINGGHTNYRNDTVSLALLPEYESDRQRALVDKFYRSAGVGRGRPFISVANPLLPSYFIDDKGNTHIPF